MKKEPLDITPYLIGAVILAGAVMWMNASRPTDSPIASLPSASADRIDRDSTIPVPSPTADTSPELEQLHRTFLAFSGRALGGINYVDFSREIGNLAAAYHTVNSSQLSPDQQLILLQLGTAFQTYQNCRALWERVMRHKGEYIPISWLSPEYWSKLNLPTQYEDLDQASRTVGLGASLAREEHRQFVDYQKVLAAMFADADRQIQDIGASLRK